MKKVIFIILMSLLIVSCGKDYEVYSKKQKKEMWNVALDEKEKRNSKEIDKINELMEKLEIAAKKGDKTAKTEWREWKEVQFSNDGLYRNYNPEDSKVDLINRRW